MENLIIIASVSIFTAGITILAGASSVAIGESSVARQALQSMSQQPDSAGEISKTLFISLSLVESSAIYCLLVSMILIFSNPFWNYMVTKIN